MVTMLVPCSLPEAVLEKMEQVNSLKVLLYLTLGGQEDFKCPHVGFGLQQRGYLARTFTQWAKPLQASQATQALMLP